MLTETLKLRGYHGNPLHASFIFHDVADGAPSGRSRKAFAPRPPTTGSTARSRPREVGDWHHLLFTCAAISRGAGQATRTHGVFISAQEYLWEIMIHDLRYFELLFEMFIKVAAESLHARE